MDPSSFEGFGNYHPGLSTAGICFRKHENGVDNAVLFNLYRGYDPFRTLIPLTLPSPQSFILLSSSKGYILCRDTSTLSYFVMCPNYGVTIYVPKPNRDHEISSPAVIFLTSGRLSFCISCAICDAVVENHSYYSFDTYCSCRNVWETQEFGIHLLPEDGKIRMNTSVALFRRTYWLTDGISPTCVVCDPADGNSYFRPFTSLKTNFSDRKNLRLGIINNYVHTVVVDGFYGELFVLNEEKREWDHVDIISTNQNSRRVEEWEITDIMPLRFESFKVECVFCDGRIMLGMVEGSDFEGGGYRIVNYLRDSAWLFEDGCDMENAVVYAP